MATTHSKKYTILTNYTACLGHKVSENTKQADTYVFLYSLLAGETLCLLLK